MLPRGVDGLLGIRFLQHFGIADFNYATNTLQLFPYDAKTEVGYQLFHGIEMAIIGLLVLIIFTVGDIVILTAREQPSGRFAR